VKRDSSLHIVATDSVRTDPSSPARDHFTTIKACAWRLFVDGELDGRTAAAADAIDDSDGCLRSKLRRVDRPVKEKVEQLALLQR
jgi:hypothetical protein